LHHPVTQEMLAALRETVAEAKDCWAKGAFVGRSEFETLQMNAENMGTVRALQEHIANLENYKLEL